MRPPKLIKPSVLAFCRELVTNPQPCYVPVRPLDKVPANECFTIVPQHVAENGGMQIIGWSIWQWPRVLIEAEFHCVWQTTDGQLLDVTPKSIRVPRILFLPDPRRSYAGRQVDNVRRPLKHDPVIARFCRVAARIYAELNAGELADVHGEIPMTEQLHQLCSEKEHLLRVLASRYGLNSPETSAA